MTNKLTEKSQKSYLILSTIVPVLDPYSFFGGGSSGLKKGKASTVIVPWGENSRIYIGVIVCIWDGVFSPVSLPHDNFPHFLPFSFFTEVTIS